MIDKTKAVFIVAVVWGTVAYCCWAAYSAQQACGVYPTTVRALIERWQSGDCDI